MSDSLHTLVHSLSQTEKRYFKLFASKQVQGKKANYLLLFESLLEQDAYSEMGLKVKLQGSGIERHFQSAKSHLKRQILKAMRSYREDRDLDQQLRNILIDIDFLWEKGMGKEAEKLVRKTLQQAENNEYHSLVLELLDRWAEIVHSRRAKTGHKTIQHISDLRKKHLVSLQQLTQSQDLRDRVFALARNDLRQENKTAIEALQPEVEAFLDQDKGPNSLPRLNHENIKAAWWVFHGRTDLALQARQAMTQIFKQRPHLQKRFPFAYKIALANHLTLAAMNQRFEEFDTLIAEIKAPGKGTPREKAEVFQNVAFLELIYFLNTGQLQRAVESVPEIRKGLNAHHSAMNKARQHAIQYNIGMVYFLLEQHRHSLEWFNMILNDPETGHRADILQAARILQLLLHFELKNIDLLDYLHRNLKRQLRSNNQHWEFESLVLGHLRKMFTATGQNTPKDLLEQLLNQITTLQSNPMLRKTPALEEVRLWTLAKFESRSLVEVMQSEF